MSAPKNNLNQLKRSQAAVVSFSQPSIKALGLNEIPEDGQIKSKFKFKAAVKPVASGSTLSTIPSSEIQPAARRSDVGDALPKTFKPSITKAKPSRMKLEDPARPPKRSSSEFQLSSPGSSSKRLRSASPSRPADDAEEDEWDILREIEQENLTAPPPKPSSRSISRNSSTATLKPTSAQASSRPPPPPIQRISEEQASASTPAQEILLGNPEFAQWPDSKLEARYQSIIKEQLDIQDKLIKTMDEEMDGDEKYLRETKKRLSQRIQEFKVELAFRKTNRSIGKTHASDPLPPPLIVRGDSLSSIVPSAHRDALGSSTLPPAFRSIQRPRESDISDVSMRSATTSLNNSTSSTTSIVNRSAITSFTDQNDSSGMVIDDEGENDDEAALWRTFDGVDVAEDWPSFQPAMPTAPQPLQSIENVSPSSYAAARPRTPPPKISRIIVPDTPLLGAGSPSYIDIPSSPEEPSPRRRSPKKLDKGKAKAIDLDEGDQTFLAAQPLTVDQQDAKEREDEKKKLIQLKKSPYYGEAIRVLRQTFKLPSFRKNQLDAVLATLAGRDTFVLMPTGGGKSLCYQLPAVCKGGKTRGVTIVVSPLKALMLDQIQHLENKGIDTIGFSGDASVEDSKEALSRLWANDRDDLPLVAYCTPEKLSKSDGFRKVLKRLYDAGNLARFVIDECHCVDTWGRDFRATYVELGMLRTDFPNVPIMALTATATPSTVISVQANLKMRNVVMLQQSFNRPNLNYEVHPKGKGLGLIEIAQFIRGQHSGESGVIYCSSRAKCETLAKQLRDTHDIPARHYHAGMSPSDKLETQTAWQNGECHAIVATIAFGMGIDKADVRYVVHQAFPKSLNGYYQETGRAGRDGKPADCILYFNIADLHSMISMIDKNKEEVPQEDLERQKHEVQDVARFCQNKEDCRRRLVLSHFGEDFPASRCNQGCDNCRERGSFESQDHSAMAIEAIKLVKAITDSGNRATMPQLIDIFRGSKKKEITSKGLHELPGAGSGANRDSSFTKRLLEQLTQDEGLGTNMITNGMGFATAYTILGKQSKAFLDGRKRLLLRIRKTSSRSEKPTQKRVVRTATYETTKTTRTEEIIEMDEGVDYDGYQPDPVEDDLPAPRISSKRLRQSRHDPYEDLPEEHSADDHGDNDIASKCYNALKALRDQIVDEDQEEDPDVIFNDYQLQYIGAVHPTDAKAFQRMLEDLIDDKNLATKKWKDYGRRFLQVSQQVSMQGVRAPVATTRSSALQSPPPTPVKKTNKPASSFDSKSLRRQYGYNNEGGNGSSTAPAKKPFRPSGSGPRPSGTSTGWLKAMPIPKR